MKSYLMRVGPSPHMTGILMRRQETEMQGQCQVMQGQCQVTMETEAGVMWPQGKEHQGLMTTIGS